MTATYTFLEHILPHDVVTWVILIFLIAYLIKWAYDVFQTRANADKVQAEKEKIEEEAETQRVEADTKRLRASAELRESYQAAFKDMEGKFTEANNRYDDLAAKSKETNLRYEALREALDARRAHEGELQCRLEALSRKIDDQAKIIAGQTAREQELTNQIAGLQDRVWTLERQNEALQAQVEKLQEERDYWRGIAEAPAKT